MIPGLPLAFAQPLVLLGLLSLPALWWLLRLVPPRPRRVDFPPTRILFEIAPKQETPARTPWWLTLLRLTLAGLVIIAAAGPMWNPPVATAASGGPLLLLLDDGWAAASTWEARIAAGQDLIARAQADRRAVALVPLSEPNRLISLETAEAAGARLPLLKPKPHAVERADILPALTRFTAATPELEVVWLSDGVDLGSSEFAAGLAKLSERRPVTVLAGGLKPAHALTGAENAAAGLSVKVLRASSDTAEAATVRALDLKGLPIGEAGFAFKPGERETDARFDLPTEIRNDIARLEILGEHSAGAVELLDKRWRRRTIGIVTGSTAETAQPLLASTYYLARALGPFADVRLAQREAPGEAVIKFIDQGLPMLVLADVGNVAGPARDRLARWIEDGGMLVRFAGPRLAAADDELVPVRLRRGGRILGGSLSWEKPQPLGAFAREGPFAGMETPGDVTVTRQVLAEPDSTLADATWATLGDGTPLVTAAKRGKGMIVLFHVTADTRWSDLPLSGAFVEMLKRIVALAGTPAHGDAHDAAGGAKGATTAPQETLAPARILDGFGVFGPPSSTARPIPVGFSGRATADNPPGFYGPPDSLLAVNTLAAGDRLQPLDLSALNARIEPYRVSEPQDLRGPIFLAALALCLIDAMIVFWLAGGLQRWAGSRRAPAAIAIGLLLVLAGPRIGAAASAPDEFAAKATETTHLAYVITGNAEVDAISKSGLQSLTVFLAQRTALEAGEPIGLDIARDELAFFPLIYWPIVPDAPKPSPQVLARIDSYMKQGGTILFDTRDAVEAPPGADGETKTPGMVALRAILSSLDIPELEPVPNEHVLTKTFFLLRDFPGRFATGRLWVEAMPAESDETEQRPARPGDGVSSIIITANDLAGAWATRPDGQAMLPLFPNDPRQREFAFRAGVNIVMYALTGNYKADQVHVPALLERLGQ